MPDWRPEVRRRLASAGLDPLREDDIVQELTQHLDDRYAELRESGASETEARQAVLEELTDSERLAREVARTAPATPPSRPAAGPERSALLSDLWLDVRFGLRMIGKTPGFATVTLLTLALGIGATTAIFTLLNAIVLRPLPFADPERLVRVWEANPERGWLTFSASQPNFLDWALRSRQFEHLAATSPASFNLTEGGEPERLIAAAVTHRFLSALGVTPALGRNFLPEEDRPGGDTRVALLGHGLWQRRFSGDPGVLARTLLLNDRSYRIVGVLPESFAWNTQLEVLVPLAADPAGNRADRRLIVIGRLRPGASIDQAQAELGTVAAALAQQYPDSNRGWTVRLESFYDWIVPEPSRRSLAIFGTAVVFVLLIAGVNVANLTLARVAARQREIAVRLALGAGRGRLVRQFLTESILLSLGGGLAGLAVAHVATRLLRTLSPAALPRLDELSIDWRVLAFGLTVSIGVGVLCGLAPALTAARRDQNEPLKETGRTVSSGPARQRLRSALVVAEVALSVALLVGAGLLLRSFWRVQQVSPGFDSSRLLAMRVNLPVSRYDVNAKAWSFYERLIAEVSALPGAKAAALTSSAPLAAGNTSTEVTVPGRPQGAGGGPGSAEWRIVGPGYFRALGISLRGREFTAQDTPDGARVTIISQSMAERCWPGQDAIGKSIVLSSGGRAPREVVGIAGDVRSSGLDADSAPMVYFPAPSLALWRPMHLMVRTQADPLKLAAAVRGALRAIDPGVPVYDVTTAEQLLDASLGPRRFTLFLLACFAGVALLLASIGLFGVMAYLVSQRLHDIGIRLALGARPVEVFRLVVGRGLLLAVAGAACGLLAALRLVPSLETLLFRVDVLDPLTFLGAPAVLLIVAFVACWVPAWRAMRVDPLVALRYE